ncbi:hypothetical protein MHN79_20790, partial [Vibrio sp. Of14-4]|uniref:hypothetical protein n=1 Tax=Vibrio sp. Of14-4 TaxID=2724878 RepID=UPI001EF20E10
RDFTAWVCITNRIIGSVAVGRPVLWILKTLALGKDRIRRNKLRRCMSEITMGKIAKVRLIVLLFTAKPFEMFFLLG